MIFYSTECWKDQGLEVNSRENHDTREIWRDLINFSMLPDVTRLSEYHIQRMANVSRVQFAEPEENDPIF